MLIYYYSAHLNSSEELEGMNLSTSRDLSFIGCQNFSLLFHRQFSFDPSTKSWLLFLIFPKNPLAGILRTGIPMSSKSVKTSRDPCLVLAED